MYVTETCTDQAFSVLACARRALWYSALVSIYGVSPLAQTGYGGVGLISVLGVLPLSNNSFIVVFDIEPKTHDVTSPNSATNPTNYSLEAATTLTQTPTRQPNIISATQDEEDPTQIIIALDCLLEPQVEYTLTVSNVIEGAGCETFDGLTEFYITAPLYSRKPVGVIITEERYRDFASESDEDGLLGLKHDSSNDIDIEPAIKSLRKRIKRRVFTQKGGFAWAPTYGVGIKGKALIRAHELQSMASTITEQILQEPDVVDASTELRTTVTTQGTFVEISVYVRMRNAQSHKLVFNQPVG
jgi:hypothetical protein